MAAKDVAVLLALWDADDEFKWHFGGGADPWAWHGVGARDGRVTTLDLSGCSPWTAMAASP